MSKKKETKRINLELIDTTIDFIRTYADNCLHSKEGGILFRELARKKLSGAHDTVMKELINEQVYARTVTSSLEKAKNNYLAPKILQPIKGYFTPQEQENYGARILELRQKTHSPKNTQTAAEMEKMFERGKRPNKPQTQQKQAISMSLF